MLSARGKRCQRNRRAAQPLCDSPPTSGGSFPPPAIIPTPHRYSHLLPSFPPLTVVPAPAGTHNQPNPNQRNHKNQTNHSSKLLTRASCPNRWPSPTMLSTRTNAPTPTRLPAQEPSQCLSPSPTRPNHPSPKPSQNTGQTTKITLQTSPIRHHFTVKPPPKPYSTDTK